MMNQVTAISRATTWQQLLAQCISDPNELLALLEITKEKAPKIFSGAANFPIRVPLGYVERMRKGDPDDPLLRQVLPISDEQLVANNYHKDPVGDLSALAASGVIHKYKGRVLLITTGACPIHCRYCFRRHFPYSENRGNSQQWTSAMSYIRADPSITEVILSGGDPLSLSNQQLSSLIDQLAQIPHLKRLRIHTRFPIVLPERIDSGLLQCIQSTSLKTIVVIHTNHPNEINHAVQKGLLALKNADVMLLNQSVLLRGVNDDASVLSKLSEALFSAGVMPYYLHMLDKVQGAAHFEVNESIAQKLYQKLQEILPGYLVPRLVFEQAGMPAKQLLPS